MLIPFDQLFRRHGVKPDGILHLGANEGQEAAMYHKLGVRNVIWVECIPEVYKKLVAHLVWFPGQRARLACVSDTDGQSVKFNVANNGGQSSSLLEFGTHTKEHPTVKFTETLQVTTSRVDTLLKSELMIGRWMLNADLQGAELLAMKGMGKLLVDRFDWAYLEVNERPLYQGCPLLPEVDAWMKDRGFDRREMQMTNFGWGDALFVRR
jgi:FkbM family methyltransferase